jgi:predicted Na+-dependent transporter
MDHTLQVVANLGVGVFVITSMLNMVLSLTLQQILEPLRNARQVILALVLDFILVPALAFMLAKTMLANQQGLSTGMILLGTAAGAPFLPKLTQVAKGNIAFAVGLMVTTIIYMPLVLPLLLSGVSVNPLQIANTLVVLMLLPLAIGLFMKARYEEAAEGLKPVMAQASNYSIILVIVLMLVLNFSNVIAVIGTGGILALAIFIVVSFVLGYFVGGIGGDSDIKRVAGLGTGMLNVSAALVVGTQNFSSNLDVTVMLVVGALFMMIILMGIGGEMGRRGQSQAVETTTAQPMPTEAS